MPTYSIKKLPNVFDAQVARLHSIKCLLTEMCAKYGGHRSNDSTFLRTIAPFEFRTNKIVPLFLIPLVKTSQQTFSGILL